MIKKVINTKDINKADAVIVSAPYERTASFHKGTVNGPKAIVECLNHQIEFFDRKLKIEAIDYIKTAHLNLGNLKKLSPHRTFQKIQNSCLELIEKNKFIFLLGGEHTVSLGYFKALTSKYDPKTVTILQIDAHCDLRKDDSDYNDEDPSHLAHSAVMRRASELGYNIVQVGIRTYSEEEYKYFNNPKNKVKVWQWGLGDKPKIKDILKSIKTKHIYLSIDVDGFDPSLMPGTGTPVQGGIKWWYGIKLIEQAISAKNLIGADIVEVSPMQDSVLTEYGAAQLCYNIISNKFKTKFPLS